MNNNENGINPVDISNDSKDVYFSNVQVETNSNYDEEPQTEFETIVKRKNAQSLTKTYIFFIAVIVLSMVISVYAIFCMNDILAITKTNSVKTVTITETIDNTKDAIDILADNDLIKCKNFCNLFVNVLGSRDISPDYEAGVYYLSGKMGLEGMLITMKGNAKTAETVQLTFPEGFTVGEIVDRLVENEVCDKATLLSAIQTVDYSYSLVSELKADEKVPYRLEGYLFPDTYDFYVGESASSVVKKFLANNDSKITEKQRTRAEKLGYSMHEIITIASIIQAEAGSEEQMKDISAVIHNRLLDKTNYPSIGCDSTADYINNKVKNSLSSTSAHTSDYYLSYYSTASTSTVVGLPAGPICNPGIAAIDAALYPADSNALFFFHDNKGKLYTADTYNEFKQKVKTYAPYLSY